MEWLNYHHLLYFWMTARRGSISRAAAELLLAPPTISEQIASLEDRLGEKLFSRSGRRLTLTEAGKTVFAYADEIFSLGQEMVGTLRGAPTGRPMRLRVGVGDVLPRWIAYRLIEPALGLPIAVRLICYQRQPADLLAGLAAGELDIVLSDVPINPSGKMRTFNHLLGECDTAFFAKPALAARLRRRFPQSLDGAPFLLPTPNCLLRSNLDGWLDQQRVRPAILGEFDDFTLLRTFAEAGHGAFAAPGVLDKELRRAGFSNFGRTSAVRSRFYAASVERKIKNPAVIAISDAARSRVFC